MLEELLIRDVGVIEDVCIRLDGGFTVVTGETGAGKTMVVSALELLLGARADGTRVRAGSDRALVEGRIAPAPSGADGWLLDDDDDLVVSREVAAGAEGARSRARIGGRLAPVSALGQLLGGVVEVHGQGDAHRLVDPSAQRDLLDRSGGPALTAVREQYASSFQRWHEAARELADIEQGVRERAREMDRLAAELAEIDAVAPEAGEDEALRAQLTRLEHAESLLEAARAAADALLADGGARDTLGQALGMVRPVAHIEARLSAVAERAESLVAEVQDLALELGNYADGLDLDPARLDELRNRQAALRGLTRKYGEDADAVIAYAQWARERVTELASGDERRAQLVDEVTQLRQALEDATVALRTVRITAGQELAASVDAHLADLAMAGAAFTVDVDPVEPGPSGGDRVTFALAANPGEPSLPLARAASGGERSRVALALRLSLAAADDAQVLVFDEVDAGVGGEVALAIGEKLARLARGRQVLCVTHLAQVAAYADQHLVVAKRVGGGRTTADVRAIRDGDRLRELSRLLSGSPHSDTAAEHAEELRTFARQRLAS